MAKKNLKKGASYREQYVDRSQGKNRGFKRGYASNIKDAVSIGEGLTHSKYVTNDSKVISDNGIVLFSQTRLHNWEDELAANVRETINELMPPLGADESVTPRKHSRKGFTVELIESKRFAPYKRTSPIGYGKASISPSKARTTQGSAAKLSELASLKKAVDDMYSLLHRSDNAAKQADLMLAIQMLERQVKTQSPNKHDALGPVASKHFADKAQSSFSSDLMPDE